MKIKNSKQSKSRQQVLVFVMVLSAVYTGFLMLLVNFESANPEASIRNLGDAFWFSIVTITTVGYGDFYPVTFEGRLVGLFYILLSLLVLGYLISRISTFVHMLNENKKYGFGGTKFKDHIVIIGWDDLAQKIVDSFSGMELRFAVVDNRKSEIELIHQKYDKNKVFALFADYEDIDNLELVNIRNSRTVFVNLDEDSGKLVFFLNLRKKYGKLNFMAMIDNHDLAETFESVGVDFVLSRDLVALNMLTDYMFKPDQKGASILITQADQFSANYKTSDFVVGKDGELAGKSFGQALTYLKETENTIPIALIRENKIRKTVFKNPESSMTLKSGDLLITISD